MRWATATTRAGHHQPLDPAAKLGSLVQVAMGEVIETVVLIVQMPLGMALIAWLAAAPAHSMGCPAPTDQDIQRLQAGERVVLQGDDCLIDIQLDAVAAAR